MNKKKTHKTPKPQDGDSEANGNFNIRLGEDLKKDVQRVAKLGHMKPAELIRFCVTEALPVVEEGFSSIRQNFKEKLNNNKA